MTSAFSRVLVASLWLVGIVGAAAQDFRMDWAYHAAEGVEAAAEKVPGEEFCFLANGRSAIPQNEPVTLYVMTDRGFAGDFDEQVFVRWWDGYMAHWVMGTWVKNIRLSPSMQVRGRPEEGEKLVDLWRVDIPAWITQPGDNFYAIQLKGCNAGYCEERYLLRRGEGDFSRRNPLGQAWSSSEEFDGQDWRVKILP